MIAMALGVLLFGEHEGTTISNANGGRHEKKKRKIIV